MEDKNNQKTIEETLNEAIINGVSEKGEEEFKKLKSATYTFLNNLKLAYLESYDEINKKTELLNRNQQLDDLVIKDTLQKISNDFIAENQDVQGIANAFVNRINAVPFQGEKKTRQRMSEKIKLFISSIQQFHSFSSYQDIHNLVGLMSISNTLAQKTEQLVHKYRQEVDSFLGRDTLFTLVTDQGQIILDFSAEINNLIFGEDFQKVRYGFTGHTKTAVTKETVGSIQTVINNLNLQDSLMDEHILKLKKLQMAVRDITAKGSVLSTAYSDYITEHQKGKNKINIPDLAEHYINLVFKKLKGEKGYDTIKGIKTYFTNSLKNPHDTVEGLYKGDISLNNFTFKYNGETIQIKKLELAVKAISFPNAGFQSESIRPILALAVYINNTNEKVILQKDLISNKGATQKLKNIVKNNAFKIEDKAKEAAQEGVQALMSKLLN